ncbi:MAG: sigma-70 family RNA polymerase sigma factor [Candidatus Hydrogenedentales bacterium]|jgi:RNA polymerase sigma factor (sigma-70 family)
MSTNDLALLSRWTRDRDPEAFAEVARRHAGMVYGACRRILGNAADAEDAAQECFLVLAQAAAPPKSNLGAWLHRVAVNKARDRARSDSQRRDREHRFASAHPTATESEWHDVEALVDEAIAALPDEHREVIVAHFMAGRSHTEIAEQLGVLRQTVSYRINKGVESIRATLKKRGVQIAAPSLVLGLTANMAEAAPPALVAAIGKLAVSGVPVAGVGFTIAGLLTLKNALIAASVLVVVAATAAFIQQPRQQPQRVASPPADAPAIASKPVQTASGNTTTQPNSSVVPPATANRADLVNDWRVLTGLVVDASGAPIRPPRGADGKMVASAIIVQASIPASSELHSTGLLNADGSFALDGIKPGSQGTVFCTFPDKDLISDLAQFSLTPDGAHHVQLKLLPGARVSGTLLDADKTPIQRVAIRAFARYFYLANDAPVDPSGAFDIGPLPPGKIRLYPVSNPDRPLSEREQDFSLTFADLVLTRGQRLSGIALVLNMKRDTIAGRVVDTTGAPIPGVLVSASLVADESDPARMPYGMRLRTVADEEGRFEITAYAPDTFGMSAEIADGKDADVPLRLADGFVLARAGDRNVELKVMDWHTMRGHVFSADTGEAMSDFTIRAVSSDGRETSHRIFHSAEDGAFSFPYTDAETSDLTVEALAPGIGSASQRVATIEGNPDLVFRIAQDEALTGQIVDSVGLPVEGAHILKESPRVLDSGPMLDEVGLAKTDADGMFTLEGLPKTADTVYVVAKDLPPVAAPIVRHAQWVIALPEGGTVEGTVFIADKPAARQHVAVFLQASSFPGSAMLVRETDTDAAGHYTITGLPAGKAEIRADVAVAAGGKDMRRFTKSVAVGDVGISAVDFRLRPADASIAGHVYLGSQPAQARVLVHTLDESGVAAKDGGIMEPNGAYQVTGLCSGPVRLEAALVEPPYRVMTRDITLPPGDTANLDLRFPEGNAAIEGTISSFENVDNDIGLSLELATSTGQESVTQKRLSVKENVYFLDKLPSGIATIRFTLVTRSAIEVKRTYAVTLEPNAVTRQDVDLGKCGIAAKVAGAVSSEFVRVFVYPSDTPLPDFRNMPTSEIDQFIMGNPPILHTTYPENTLAPLLPGTYTVLALAFGTGVYGGDQANAGLRYATGKVSVAEDAEASVALSLE